MVAVTCFMSERSCEARAVGVEAPSPVRVPSGSCARRQRIQTQSNSIHPFQKQCARHLNPKPPTTKPRMVRSSSLLCPSFELYAQSKGTSNRHTWAFRTSMLLRFCNPQQCCLPYCTQCMWTNTRQILVRASHASLEPPANILLAAVWSMWRCRTDHLPSSLMVCLSVSTSPRHKGCASCCCSLQS